MKKSILLVIVIFCLFCPIVFANTSNTATTEILNIDKKTVIDSIVADMVSYNFNIMTINDYQIIFKSDISNEFAKSLLNYSTYYQQLNYNIVQIENTVKISSNSNMIGITNLGATNTQTGYSSLLFTYLQYLKIKWNGNFGYGLVISGDSTIKKVAKHSDAETNSFIETGCKITKINDRSFSDINIDKYIVNAKEGETVKLKIKNSKGETNEIILVCKFIPAEKQDPNSNLTPTPIK